jgi:peptidoglycan/xylan/chitin deacetylase (PgdA/CDA1 family)
MIPRTPDILRFLFPDIIFRLPAAAGEPPAVYLTFDDGPHPYETEFVLRCLSEYDAWATFFVTGMQAEKHPELLQKIREAGHCIANHGYSHMKAGKVTAAAYLEDVKRGKDITGSTLFRPPYGRLTPGLYFKLRTICRPVMWDVITEDYRQDVEPDALLRKTLRQIRPGSVVVFHDQPKARKNMEFILPALLENLHQKGFRMKSLADYARFVE